MGQPDNSASSRDLLESIAQEVNIEERSQTPVSANIPPIPTSTPKGSMKRNIFNIGIAIIIVLLAVIAILVYIVLSKDNKEQKKEETNNQNTQTGSGTQNGQNNNNNTQESPKRIAYVLEGNIWVMDSDGKNKKQITTDAGGTYNDAYYLGGWKSTGVLSFSKCDDIEETCVIYSYNLQNEKLTIEREIDGMTGLFTWSDDLSILVYEYVVSDTRYIAIWDGEEETVVKEFTGEIPGRGIGFGDSSSISFSPNGEYFIVANTVIREHENFITVFKKDGTEVESVSSDSSNYASFVIWLSSNEYAYLNEDSDISKKKIGSSTLTQLVIDLDGYNIQLSPDGKNILYWADDESSSPKSWIYNLENKTTTLLTNDFVEPKWYSDDVVIGEVTGEASEPGIISFSYQGLGRIGVDGKNYIVLIGESVDGFEIEK